MKFLWIILLNKFVCIRLAVHNYKNEPALGRRNFLFIINVQLFDIYLLDRLISSILEHRLLFSVIRCRGDV